MPNPASRLSKAKHPTAEQLYDEVAWMGQRLIEAREAIGDAPLVVTYLDTNGNERQKTNPAYDAYNALFSTFLKGARALEDMLTAAPEQSGDAKAALERLKVTVGDKFKVG